MLYPPPVAHAGGRHTRSLLRAAADRNDLPAAAPAAPRRAGADRDAARDGHQGHCRSQGLPGILRGLQGAATAVPLGTCVRRIEH